MHFQYEKQLGVSHPTLEKVIEQLIDFVEAYWEQNPPAGGKRLPIALAVEVVFL